MDIEGLTGYAKRTGFFWPAAEIYGGVSGIFDYGHLGAILKRQFEELWLDYFVNMGTNCHLIEGSNMLPEKPLIASGHASRFNDIIVGCTKCKAYYRADVLLNELGVEVSEGADAAEISAAIKKGNVRCPKCKGELMEPKAFNMMIDVNLGPEKSDKGFLRPETAQSTYLNFFREFNILRKKLPLGIAIIGRAYRNEISPRQGLYRMRELTQAELQMFFNPGKWEPEDREGLLNREVSVLLYKEKEAKLVKGIDLIKSFGIPPFYAYHLCLIARFYNDILNVPKEKLRFLEKGGPDKAFYNKIHMDVEVDVGSLGGFKEMGGLHYRGDYDLSSHSTGSNQDLSVEIDGEKVMPHVLELSFGVDRNIWMLIDLFFIRGERSVLMIPKTLAPYSVAVFPLQKDEKLTGPSERLYASLKRSFRSHYDESGSIGRRYARMDEIGTPFCITVDFDSVQEGSDKFGTVTVRDRDTKAQERVAIKDLETVLRDRLQPK